MRPTRTPHRFILLIDARQQPVFVGCRESWINPDLVLDRELHVSCHQRPWPAGAQYHSAEFEASSANCSNVIGRLVFESGGYIDRLDSSHAFEAHREFVFRDDMHQPARVIREDDADAVDTAK